MPSSYTYNLCAGITTPLDATNDRNNNRIFDSCEYEIARALRPIINNSFYETAGEREPYWSISRHPTRDYRFQVFYALSFWEDAGIPSLGGYGSHHGDSEFVILEIASNSESTWGVVAATLSAHWHAGSSDATATYAAYDLEFPGVPNLRVWSSIGKHANYRSREVCEWGPGGIAWSDTCAGENIGLYLEVRADANLGNYFHVPEPRTIGTQIIDRTSSASPQRQALEHFWTGDVFAGWNLDRSPSATRYADMLQFYGF